MHFFAKFQEHLSPDALDAYFPFFYAAQALHRAFEERRPRHHIELLLKQYTEALFQSEKQRFIPFLFPRIPLDQVHLPLVERILSSTFTISFERFQKALEVYDEQIPSSKEQGYTLFKVEEEYLFERLFFISHNQRL